MEKEIDPLEKGNRLLAIGIGMILLAGVVMRLVALGEHPYGLYQDEAVNGLDALTVLAGAHPIYFAANNGREPFFIYLVAATVGIFGRTPLGIRAAAALVGLLTLPATYLLGRAWGSARTGWLSAGILAVMLWHVHLSRIGLRAVSLPLFSALALGLGALALQRQSRGLALAAGVVYGMSFYTYLAARFTPLALLLMLAYGAVWHRDWLRERWRLLTWMGAATAMIVLPLAIYAMLHPDIVLGRSTQVAIWNRADFLPVLADHILRTLGMFNWRGDWIWRHNVPNRPVFDPLIGLAFLAGAALGILRWRKRPALALCLIWIGIMMLPTILADDAPHFLRSVGVLPVVALLPATALDKGAAWLSQKWGPRWAAAGLVSTLALSTVLTANDYFGCWVHLPVRLSAFDYAGCYRTDPVRGYFFQAEATTLAFEANASEGPLYLDRRFFDSFPSVRFLVTKHDVSFYSEGDTLLPQAPPMSLIAWPHDRLESALGVLPQPSAIEITPGPETHGDREEPIYRLYVRYTARPLSQLSLSDTLAIFEGGIALVAEQMVREEDSLLLTLSWSIEQPQGMQIQSFVHLVEPQGNVLEQVDQPPGTVYYPPLSWTPGSVIIHAVRLPVTVRGDQSSLQVWIGLYDPTGNRIPILASDADQRDGALILALPDDATP